MWGVDSPQRFIGILDTSTNFVERGGYTCELDKVKAAAESWWGEPSNWDEWFEDYGQKIASPAGTRAGDMEFQAADALRGDARQRAYARGLRRDLTEFGKSQVEFHGTNAAMAGLGRGATGVFGRLTRQGGFRGAAARRWDWEHIFDRHSDFGSVAAQRGRAEQVFKGLNKQQIKSRCNAAWGGRKRMKTQVSPDGTTRIYYEGVDPASGKGVGFWFNETTGTVETAFPIGG